MTRWKIERKIMDYEFTLFIMPVLIILGLIFTLNFRQFKGYDFHFTMSKVL